MRRKEKDALVVGSVLHGTSVARCGLGGSLLSRHVTSRSACVSHDSSRPGLAPFKEQSAVLRLAGLCNIRLYRLQPFDELPFAPFPFLEREPDPARGPFEARLLQVVGEPSQRCNPFDGRPPCLCPAYGVGGADGGPDPFDPVSEQSLHRLVRAQHEGHLHLRPRVTVFPAPQQPVVEVRSADRPAVVAAQAHGSALQAFGDDERVAPVVHCARRADPVRQRPDLGVHAPRLPVLVDPVVALPLFVHPLHESGAHCFEGRQRALLPRALRLPGARPRGHARRGPAVEGADLLRRFAQGLSRDVYPRARAFAAGAEHPPRCLPDEQVRVDAQGRPRHVPVPSGGRDR